MIPVEDNVFQRIPWSTNGDETRQIPGNSENEPPQTKRNYLKPFKRIASILKIKQTQSEEDKARRSAWNDNNRTDNARSRSRSMSMSTMSSGSDAAGTRAEIENIGSHQRPGEALENNVYKQTIFKVGSCIHNQSW